MRDKVSPLLLAGLVAGLLTVSPAAGFSAEASAEWPAWRGDGSGASHSGAEMVDSLDQAKLAWQSEEVGLSACMYPGGRPGTGWCDPVIAGGRVFVYWFRRAGPDLVDLHWLPASRGWASLTDPPDSPEAFTRGGGHRCALPAREMADIQRHVRADDIVTCLDDRTGKKLWERVFAARGINHVRVYSPLCVPCAKDGRLYVLGSAGRLYALDAPTGKTIWESDIGLNAEVLDQMMEVAARSRHRAYDSGWLNTSVVCADGVVAVGEGARFLGGRGNSVGMVALDAATGRRLWTTPDCLDRFGSPSVWRHDGKEYLLAAGQRMVLVEPKTGKVLWAIGGPEDSITDGCALAVSGDYVVVAKNIAKTVGAKPLPSWRGPSCYRVSLTGVERVWALPMVEGISLIAPAIYGRHAYVCVKGGVACVELETGKVVGAPLAGFSSAYAGYAMGDGLIFRLGLKAAKVFPQMKELQGTLPGKPDFGEIHAPATANGRVYWRGQRSVWCYDFRKNPPPASTTPLPAARDLSGIKADPSGLAQAVEREPWPTRAAAADLLRALGEKGKPASVVLQKLLLAAIAARDWGDTDLLLDTLLAIEPAATRPAAAELAKLLEAGDELTVRLGFHGLRLMGPQAAEAAPALVKHLDAGKPELAVLAARALGRIGPGASTAVPALLKCLESQDLELTCQAAKALCHLAPSDPAARGAAMEAALTHPWFVLSNRGGATCPRRNSYKTVALSLLGKEAIPQFLERARAVIAMGQKPYKKGTPAPRVDYVSICYLADAAFAIDPKSAADFLPLLGNIPRTNPPKVDGGMLKMTEMDLKGTLDQRDPLGHVKSREQAGQGKKAGPPEKKDEE
jgi:hypothetical protein